VTTTDESELLSRPVYATTDITDDSVQTASTEAEQLDAMNLEIGPPSFTEEDVTHRMDWQTNVYVASESDRRGDGFAMAIVQLPTSSIARTYIRTGAPPVGSVSGESVVDQLIAGASSNDEGLCVNPDGLIGSSPQGVLIVPGSTNSNGVQFLGAADGRCV
jgi:hypothetical protein